jgi:hypothetical protein
MENGSMSDRASRAYAVPAGQPINAPYFYASSFSVQASANDVTVILHDTLPVAGNDGVSSDNELRRPVGIIKLSPQSAKEFADILQDAMTKYESLYKIRLITNASSVESDK